jgi:hypothetical protein
MIAILLQPLSLNSQEKQTATKLFFVEPGIMTGKVVPNYKNHPQSRIQKVFSLNIGSINFNPELKSWVSYYNVPNTGLSIDYTSYGNDPILGRSITLMPYITINTGNHVFSSWHFKTGLGASYFTKQHTLWDNPGNLSIGSDFTWAFKLFLYKSWEYNKNVNLKLGGGYFHHSNGHTELPNYGLNSALLSVACQFHSKYEGAKVLHHRRNFRNKNIPHRYFWQLSQGIGFHEYGGPTGPVGGAKRAVHASSLAGGIIIKKHLKLRTGFTYRYYEHYYHQITKNEIEPYIKHPGWNASNIFVFIGGEFLIGHFGVDIEGGLNLHKPFYKEYSKEFLLESELEYLVKSLFPSSLGINYYLINTEKLPKNNIRFGAHIHANQGQADYTGISIGYVRVLSCTMGE